MVEIVFLFVSEPAQFITDKISMPTDTESQNILARKIDKTNIIDRRHTGIFGSS